MTGQALAVADKIDTLVGIFGIGQPPTGDKDPFALRRAALGVLRIMIEGGLPLDLVRLLDAALEFTAARARIWTARNGCNAGLWFHDGSSACVLPGNRDEY